MRIEVRRQRIGRAQALGAQPMVHVFLINDDDPTEEYLEGELSLTQTEYGMLQSAVGATWHEIPVVSHSKYRELVEEWYGNAEF